jgi:hypothetical protein
MFYLVQYQRDGGWEDVELPENVKLFRMEKKYPGNTGKLNDWYSIYNRIGVEHRDWCIFTDMHDVVFQKDIPALPDDKDALVTYEGKMFRDIGFWKAMLPERMLDRRAYNCGTFAMRDFLFKEYLEIVHNKYQEMMDWKRDFSAGQLGIGFPFNSQYVTDTITANVGSIFNGIADTVIFNEYIQKIDNLMEWDDVCCYNLMIEEKKAKMQYRRLCRMDGRPYSIAHFNGKNPVMEAQK